MTTGRPNYIQTFPISALFDPRVFARQLSAMGNHPKILYHYTSEAGLKGIVSPPSWDFHSPALDRAAQLWASDVRYMNDVKELLFGAVPLVQRLRAAAADSATPPGLVPTLAWLADVFSNEDVLSWDLKCYAASLTEAGDQMTQWQSYAGGTGGYAIGFSWDALAEHAFAFHPKTTVAGTTPFPAGLRRVTYDNQNAAAVADDVVNWLRDTYEQPGVVRMMVEGGDVGQMFLATVVLGQLASVKHGAWSHEREWRLVAVSEPQYPAKTRNGRDGEDLPYLDMAVNMNDTDVPTTIAKLVVGPGSDQPSRIEMARELMEEHGHDPSVVVGSDAPLRG